jgi:ribosomal protein L20A (L18A)
MIPDKKVLSTKIHKTNFRRFMRDERLPARLRFGAELLLARMEGIFPVELIDTIIYSEFGSSTRLKSRNDGEIDLIDSIDKEAAQDLKKQWQDMIKEDHVSTSTTNN